MSAAEEGRGFEWLGSTLTSIRDPFLADHPHHRRPVADAMARIAADPYTLPLRPYNGHDAPAATYVYSVPRTRVEIVFSILRDPPDHLALFQILDWDDLDV